MVVSALSIRLRTEHLLTCLPEGCTLGDQVYSRAKIVHLIANILGGVGSGQNELIPQSIVIVSAHIVDYHSIIYSPADSCALAALNTEDDLVNVTDISVNITGQGSIKHTSLQAVADSIVKYCNAANGVAGRLDLLNLCLVSLGRSVYGRAHSPTLTIYDSMSIYSMNSRLNLLHSSEVVKSHKVKAQSVKIVLVYPIGCRVNHKLTEHISLGCGIVATAGCRRICAGCGVSIVIIRNDFVE